MCVHRLCAGPLPTKEVTAMQSADYEMFEDADELPMFYDDDFATENDWWDDDDDDDEIDVERGFEMRDLFELCVKPTFADAFNTIFTLLMWCLIFRLATQAVKLPTTVCHITSAFTGLVVLHYFFSLTTTVVVIFALVSYLCLYCVSLCLKKNRGPIMGITSVAFLFICELFVITETEWHKVRGSQMLLAMKAISLAFDTDYGALHHLPSFIEFMGYMLCAGTSIFGPWIPYRDYVAIFEKPKWDARWLWKVFVNTLAAFIFISLSTCWVDWFIPNTVWRWGLAYRDALSFRSSHYFVSFLSEASSVMSGLGNNGDTMWTLPVARPYFIEIPRSLVEVVVYWNMPMHNWLKTYVFRTTRRFGSLAAVLSTYAVSSLLHGLNFQLSAVLLSLGLYTYIEYLLRRKLSTVFSACIQVRPCHKDCVHRNKERNLLVLLTNVVFSLIAVFHLSYLGVMFSAASNLQEQGYSYMHTLSKWGQLNFASHWFALATYMFYFLV